MSYIHAIGMKILLKSLKNTFLDILMGSGYFRPIPATNYIGQNRKIAKNREKCDFSKIHIFLYGGRKYDFWPEIDPLGPGKHPETLY